MIFRRPDGNDAGAARGAKKPRPLAWTGSLLFVLAFGSQYLATTGGGGGSRLNL
jgi:hypothetical protein